MIFMPPGSVVVETVGVWDGRMLPVCGRKILVHFFCINITNFIQVILEYFVQLMGITTSYIITIGSLETGNLHIPTLAFFSPQNWLENL